MCSSAHLQSALQSRWLAGSAQTNCSLAGRNSISTHMLPNLLGRIVHKALQQNSRRFPSYGNAISVSLCSFVDYSPALPSKDADAPRLYFLG